MRATESQKFLTGSESHPTFAKHVSAPNRSTGQNVAIIIYIYNKVCY